MDTYWGGGREGTEPIFTMRSSRAYRRSNTFNAVLTASLTANTSSDTKDRACEGAFDLEKQLSKWQSEAIAIGYSTGHTDDVLVDDAQC